MAFQHVLDEPQMLIYVDGNWIEVGAPEDFGNSGESVVFSLALTTDRIFFETYREGNNKLYVVAYTESNPILTLCG